jgi:hypothetical protein
MTDTIDGTAEDLGTADPHDTPSTAIARRERRSEVIRPLDPESLVDSFKAYQELLPRLLDASDWQGTPGARGSFVTKSGWRKIATAFDLDVEVSRWHVERDDAGRPLRVEVLACAIAPSGRSMQGDGYCSLDEFTGKRRNDPKLENTMRGTATTRAKNRAISDLVGMGQVSAEEVTAGGGQPDPGPPFGPPVTGAVKQLVGGAATTICNDDVDQAKALVQDLRDQFGGYVPQAAAVTLLVAAGLEVPK